MPVNIYENFRDMSPNILISENKNNSYEQHFHRNLELIYVREGMMQAIINGTSYEYTKDTIVFVPSYYLHQFNTPKFSDVLVLVIPYEAMSDLTEFLKDEQLSPFLGDTVYNQNIRKVLELLLKMRSLSNNFVLHGFVNVIFGLLINHYPRFYTRNNNNSNIIVQILTYIGDNYKEQLTLETIAAKFNYNKYYISHLFKQYVGVNYKTYINILRLQHVISNFTQSTEHNISATAYQCGFSSMPTFYRIFQETYGMTPKEFFKNLSQDIEYNEVDFSYKSISASNFTKKPQ